MEPLAALSLVSNITQLLEGAHRAISLCSEIAKSGTSSHHRRLKKVVDDFRSLSKTVAETCEDERNGSSSVLWRGASRDFFSRETVLERKNALQSLGRESYKAANELAALLGDLSLEDGCRKRKRDTVRCALRGVWKQSDVARLERDFWRLQQELSLRQCFLISEDLSEVKAGIKDLKKTNAKDSSQYSIQLHDLQQHLRDAATPVLGSLAYEQLYYRFDKIPKAYSETFAWIFGSSVTPFSAWAVTDDGIFWITGKAGSGKSTLMKFLCSHSATRALLQEWAAKRRLVIASHFFWIAGGKLQRSQEGLLRSILYQILQECPELAPLVMQSRGTDKNLLSLLWTTKELADSLLTIARQRTLSTCFCFFIDGLDEYDGEHAEIIRILSDLTSSPFMKICTASRPWNIFQRTYGREPGKMLTMQDLTKIDIEHYITGTLRTDAQFCQMSTLR